MNFLKYRLIYGTLSGLLVIGSLIALIAWGLRPSIDFTGGSLLELSLAKANHDTEQLIHLISQVDDRIQVASLQPAGENRIILRLNPIDQHQANQIRETLATALNQPVTEDRFETIGPTLGRELLIKTLVGVLLAASFILTYVAYTFKNVQYGVAAILAMFHDTIILIGSFAVFGQLYHAEVDTLFVTAVLTTLSFSVHDTVVVFDRIRESLREFPKANFSDICNKALTETMTRSLNNSFTIIFMLTALLLLGGSTMRWFVAALLIGTVLGTYSSPFVAVPILEAWNKLRSSQRKPH